jgi:hypothetical protein
MNKLEDAIKKELSRLSAEHDQEGVESVLDIVGPMYAPPKAAQAPKKVHRHTLDDLDDPEIKDAQI